MSPFFSMRIGGAAASSGHQTGAQGVDVGVYMDAGDHPVFNGEMRVASPTNAVAGGFNAQKGPPVDAGKAHRRPGSVSTARVLALSDVQHGAAVAAQSRMHRLCVADKAVYAGLFNSKRAPKL